MFTILEIAYLDPVLWKKYGLDKPLSTILWIIANLVVGFIIQYFFKLNWMLSYVFLSMSFRFATFNYIFNYVHDRKWNYLGLNYWDRKKNAIPFPFLQILEAFVLLVGVMQFLYFGCWLYNSPGINIIFDLPKFCNL